MKKLIYLGLSISIMALGISLVSMQNSKRIIKKYTESYKTLTENSLKLAEKLCSVNQDLLSRC